MAQEVVLRLRVEGEGDIKNIERELKDTSKAFNEVEKSSENYSGAIKKSNPIVEKLDQATGGLVNTLLDVQDASKKAGFSLKSLKLAFVATGIGAFVVAVGLLVTYWDDIQEFVTGVNRELEHQLELIQDNVKELEHELDVLEKLQALAESRGESAAMYNKQKEETLQRLLDEQRLELANQLVRLNNLKELQQAGGNSLSQLGNLAGELFIKLGKIVEAFLDPLRRIGLLENTDDLGLGEAGLGVKTLTERWFGTEEDIAETEASIKRLELQILDSAAKINNVRRGDGQTRERQERVNAFDGTLFEEELQREQLVTEATISEFQKRFQAYNLLLLDQAGADKRAKDLELARERALQQAKISIIGQTFGAIASILGTNSKAGKAAAIAQALINTYQGVTEVWSTKSTLPEPFATISRIASTATVLGSGLQAVQAIKSTQLPQIPGAVGGISAGGGGNIAAVAQPSFNVIGNTGINQLNDAINERNQEPVQAYVVMRDIERGQNIERNSISEASVG